LTFGVGMSDCFALEASYFRLDSSDEAGAFVKTVSPLTALISPFLNINGTAVPAVGFTYHSDLKSAEAGPRYMFGCDECLCGPILAGVRYFKQDEQFNLFGSVIAAGTTLATET